MSQSRVKKSNSWRPTNFRPKKGVLKMELCETFQKFHMFDYDIEVAMANCIRGIVGIFYQILWLQDGRTQPACFLKLYLPHVTNVWKLEVSTLHNSRHHPWPVQSSRYGIFSSMVQASLWKLSRCYPMQGSCMCWVSGHDITRAHCRAPGAYGSWKMSWLLPWRLWQMPWRVLANAMRME